MATANLSDLDVGMRDAVTRQLDWDPEVDASAIGVAAKDGAVTLTGYIGTYAGKLAAERAAKGVRGVESVSVRSVRPTIVALYSSERPIHSDAILGLGPAVKGPYVVRALERGAIRRVLQAGLPAHLVETRALVPFHPSLESLHQRLRVLRTMPKQG